MPQFVYFLMLVCLSVGSGSVLKKKIHASRSCFVYTISLLAHNSSESFLKSLFETVANKRVPAGLWVSLCDLLPQGNMVCPGVKSCWPFVNYSCPRTASASHLVSSPSVLPFVQSTASSGPVKLITCTVVCRYCKVIRRTNSFLFIAGHGGSPKPPWPSSQRQSHKQPQ